MNPCDSRFLNMRRSDASKVRAAEDARKEALWQATLRRLEEGDPSYGDDVAMEE